jgi:hypothetical protein
MCTLYRMVLYSGVGGSTASPTFDGYATGNGSSPLSVFIYVGVAYNRLLALHVHAYMLHLDVHAYTL